MDWIIVVLLIVLLVVGMSSKEQEGFTLFGSMAGASSGGTSECPSHLTRVNGQFHMTHKGKEVTFGNLQEYIDFVKALRHRGIRCPVLYAEPVQDAQGGISIRQPDDPITPTTGLMSFPSNYVVKGNELTATLGKHDPVASTQMPIGFDPANQAQGEDLPIDRFFHVGDNINPYSASWGGQKATTRAIQAGEMEGDQVYIP